MSLLRDTQGRIVPLGRVERRLSEHLIPGGGSLPSWLTCDVGTLGMTGTSSSTDVGNAKVTTAASANSYGRIKTAFEIQSDQYDEIVWSVSGLRWDTDTASNPQPIDAYVDIKRDGGANGISLQHIGTDETAKLVVYDGSTNPSTSLEYELLTPHGGSRVRRNITVRWRPKLGLVYVLEDDAEMAEIDVSDDQVAGPVRCGIQMMTREASAHWMHACAFDLTLIHN